MIQGVLFDMDGVLLDTEALGMELLGRMARELGYPFTREDYLSILGCNQQTSLGIMRERFGPAYPHEELERRLYGELQSIARAGRLPLKKGYRECMEGLKARGLRLALATSSPRTVWEVYSSHNPALLCVFDATVCGMEAPNGKPAPDIYQKAAQKLGLSPEECAGVEDSRHGLRSLRAAGCLSVMIPDLLPYDESLAPYVDVRLNDLTGLCPLLDLQNREG